jgi:hypothetical protein
MLLPGVGFLLQQRQPLLGHLELHTLTTLHTLHVEIHHAVAPIA